MKPLDKKSQLVLAIEPKKPVGKRRGPKRRASSGVPHRSRPVHKGRHPVHITLRIRHGLPSLRQQVVRGLVTQILREMRQKVHLTDFQIVEHSIQTNHLHLIVESADGPTLAPETRAKNPLRSGLTNLVPDGVRAAAE